MRIGIDKKVTLLTVTLILFMGFLLGIYFIRHETGALNYELDERAMVIINSLKTSSEYPILIRDQAAISRLVKGVLEQKDVAFCRIEDIDGNLLFEEGLQKKSSVREFTVAVVIKRVVEEDDDEDMILGSPIETAEKIGKIYLTISLAGLQQKVKAIKRTIAIVAIVTIILTALASTLLLRFILSNPIHALVKGTEKIAGGDLKHKVLVKRNDEIGMLAASFNKMTEDLSKTMKSLEISNKKLTQSNKQLQDFVYIASHDLREPVRKISAFGELLAESLEGSLDDDQNENLNFMVDAAIRMQEMIDALLVYSRVTTRTKPFNAVDLNEVITNLKNVELAFQLEETKGTIEVPDQLPVVFADRAQMHQILQNLIGNGLKYHQKDNSTPKVIVRANSMDNDMLRVEVKDNGIGIEKDYQKEVFTMFRRLHSRGEYEGTGIGLAVCKKIAERHRGEIGVESVPGSGSTFWFTIAKGDPLKNIALQVD